MILCNIVKQTSIMNNLYPVGIQNFREIREGNYLYIDKTELIYRMVKTGKYYFLSRPRRFGKSLLVSTIEAYFLGQKDLFKGLAMEKLESEWKEYPVLHLDLNSKKYEDKLSPTAILNQHLEKWEQMYGDEKKDRSPEERFSYLIEKISITTGRNVVVLIDEYDKPMLQAIGNDELMDEYRNTLKAFYGVLKSSDQYLRFALLTGVTKFSKVSVFSDLNNLEDISILRDYNNLCGITEKELLHYFPDEIKDLGERNDMTYDETCQKLRLWYDGYHFSSSPEGIYNPFSILNVMKSREFGSFWFETGTPTFLVELLKRSSYNLYSLTEEVAFADTLGGTDSMYTNPVPILYQSGYLTIKGYDKEFRTYNLGFPNREVEDGFTRFLLPYYASIEPGKSSFQIISFVQDVRKGEINRFMTRLQSFFADIPYELTRQLELHYQNVLFIVFRLLGFYTEVEYHTSSGRIDMVVKTNDYIYVMEFKLEGTAEEAIKQINDKQYALPFASDGRKLIKVGVNFNNTIKGIEKWIIE